ncbi:hypothetical protein ACFLT5_00955 [Chloroflexota bacterium]
MTERRLRIKGRLGEILSGEPQALEVGSTTSESPSGGTGMDEREPDAVGAGVHPEADVDELPAPPVLEPETLSDEELDRAMYQEAELGEFVPEEEDAPWVSRMDWPPTPDMELAFFEEDLMAEDLEDLDEDEAGDSVPTLEDAMDSYDMMGGTSARSPGSETGGLLSAGVGSSLSSETPVAGEVQPLGAVDIQDPGIRVERLELPGRQLTDAQRVELQEHYRVRMQEMAQQIDEVSEQVLSQVGENENIATECFNQLLKARDVILNRDVDRLAQAEYYIEQARARLRRAKASRSGAIRHAWWIFLWGLIWGVVFVGVLVMFDSELVNGYLSVLGLSNTPVDPDIFLPAMVWGGIGGVVAIWYSLFKHVSLRDFDSQYNITYVGKPFFGLVLGATVYMIVYLGIVSLGIWPGQVPDAVEGFLTPSIAPWLIYLLAWAAGFKENRVFGAVDSMLKRTFSAS